MGNCWVLALLEGFRILSTTRAEQFEQDVGNSCKDSYNYSGSRLVAEVDMDCRYGRYHPSMDELADRDMAARVLAAQQPCKAARTSDRRLSADRDLTRQRCQWKIWLHMYLELQ